MDRSIETEIGRWRKHQTCNQQGITSESQRCRYELSVPSRVSCSPERTLQLLSSLTPQLFSRVGPLSLPPSQEASKVRDDSHTITRIGHYGSSLSRLVFSGGSSPLKQSLSTPALSIRTTSASHFCRTEPNQPRAVTYPCCMCLLVNKYQFFITVGRRDGWGDFTAESEHWSSSIVAAVAKLPVSRAPASPGSTDVKK